MNKEKLKEVIGDTLDLDENNIGNETTYDAIEKWDSLNHLRLVTALESEFDITLTMDEINTMDSYSRIVQLVTKHLSG